MCITYAVYCATTDQLQQLKRSNTKLSVLAVALPCTVMLPTVFYNGNAPCFHGDIFFNCVCINPSLSPWIFVANWMLPCTALMAATIFLMVKIGRNKQNVLNHLNERSNYRLAMLIYRIPPINFIVLTVNFAITLITDVSEDTVINTILVMANLLVFAMPLVCVLVIAIYSSELRSDPNW